MSTQAPEDFPALLAAVKRIAATVATENAPGVDAGARFPHETLAALREVKALSAPVPKEFGGLGCNLRQLADLCAALGHGCGSSAMVLAMHYIQVGCIARHGQSSEWLKDYLRAIVRHQYLIGSMTSEVGTWGETRTSICAVERGPERFKLDKDATTGSYCAQADSILVTCRKDSTAAPSDQVLVLVLKDDYKLTQTSTWDTMGMRGTCSPGFKLESSGLNEQIIPGPYADSFAQTMLPYSHLLWSALWWGIAANAVQRASEVVRAAARKNPGTVPSSAVNLAEVSQHLQAMRHNWIALVTEFDELNARPGGADELQSMSWSLKMANLKVNSSEAAPRIVHMALQIAGIMGYKNDSKFSLGRHYRDVLSGALMVSNDRIIAKCASMLLVVKES